MAHPTLEYIQGLRAQLQTKKAEIVGQSPATIPGSEHDAKPPASAKEPDKEIKDQTMVPNSGLTVAGAGDDSKITHTNDLIAGQAALTPEKKPEVTGGADDKVPGGKTAEQKAAEVLGAEIISGVDAWFAAKKAAEEAKAAADTKGPSAGTGTAEALITDTGKEPEQTKDVIAPAKKDEVTPDALKPATGEGASGETAAAAKEAAEKCCADGKCGKCAKCKAEAEKCCADGKCGKCAKCKAAAGADKTPGEDKKAGALDMTLTKDVLAKIAAVVLATEEGTQLATDILSKEAGAEAAEKTLNFLRAQNDLAQKQAEYEQGQRDAMALLEKAAQDASAEGAVSDDDAADDGSVEEIADTLDEMVQAGEITEEQADQFVVELAQALAGEGDTAGATDASGCDASDAGCEKKEQPKEEKTAAQKFAEFLQERAQKKAQDAGAAAAGDAALNAQVAVPPEQLSTENLPDGDMGNITPEAVLSALEELVSSGEITEEEAQGLLQAMMGGDDQASPEEIATALQEAVAAGKIKPEDVQQILAELEGVSAPDTGAASGSDAGAAAAGGAPAAGAAAVAPSDEPKTAGAKLIADIQAARTAKTAAAKAPDAK